jgi:D-amino peptidase
MKKALSILAVVLLAAALAAAGQPPAKKLKVFISVDMEGIAGLIHWDETGEGGADYPLFRKLMTEEANAAVAGALEAGATEIVVRDGTSCPTCSARRPGSSAIGAPRSA